MAFSRRCDRSRRVTRLRVADASHRLDARSSTIRPGQRLKVRATERRQASSTATASRPSVAVAKTQTPTPSDVVSQMHTVRPGESSSVIAAAYKVRTADVLRWNNLSKGSVLHIGDQLIVFVPEAQARNIQTASQQESGAPVVHTVRRGQNPTTIARRYGVKLSDLFRWNEWGAAPLLQIGDEVLLYQ